MFDIGWSELFLVALVALVAVGPKDLPRAMHALGVWAGKVRRMFQAIQHDFDRMTFEAEQIERKKNNESDEPEE